MYILWIRKVINYLYYASLSPVISLSTTWGNKWETSQMFTISLVGVYSRYIVQSYTPKDSTSSVPCCNGLKVIYLMYPQLCHTKIFQARK